MPTYSYYSELNNVPWDIIECMDDPDIELKNPYVDGLVIKICCYQKYDVVIVNLVLQDPQLYSVVLAKYVGLNKKGVSRHEIMDFLRGLNDDVWRLAFVYHKPNHELLDYIVRELDRVIRDG